MTDLTGRIAIVTGSTGGIGLSIARRLAARGCGVVVHGRAPEAPDPIRQLLATGAEIEYVGADLGAPLEASAALRDAALRRWGRIDHVVNNAAAFLHKPNADVTPAEWSHVLTVNVVAPFYVTRACADALAESRGSVVVVSSTNAIDVNRDNIVYDTAKAALNHQTRSLALELRDRGVRVNTVMAGGTKSPALKKWVSDFTGDAEAGRRRVDEQLARGIIADPDRMAEGIIAVLVEPSGWMSGADIVLDGGIRLGA